jgi:hypothetical protein
MELKNAEFGYLGNANVKKDGISHNWTLEEVREYSECVKSAVYFAEKYVKIVHLDSGLIPFTLYPYQRKMFEHFEDNRFSIVLACRQSGKSISSVVYLLWYALFHPDKTIAILANKGATAREMLARVTLALENLPFFLQAGCKTLNKGSLEFSNNSRIIATATSGSSIRGMSISLLFLDEFAFVENDGEFYTSTYPVISSGKTTRVIITSTANGLGNVYHKLWEGATTGTNSYKPFRVDWHDVPGRDASWKEETIANTSAFQFEQEFGNRFIGVSKTLVSADCLLQLRASDPIYSNEGARVYHEPEKDRNYIMLVDVAQGRGQDYSTFNILDVTEDTFEQVAVYQNNIISPLLFPEVIKKYATLYNMCTVVLESNDQGAMVGNELYYGMEYENTFIQSYVKRNDVGIMMTRKVKRIGCSNIKDIIEQGTLKINDADTIHELTTFVSRGSSYEAGLAAHDDLVMNLVMFGYFVTLSYFNEIYDKDMRSLIYDDQIKEIEHDMIPFGFIDDGVSDEFDQDRDGWNLL